MAGLRESFRRWLQGPKIRPWGLLGAILVLLVCLPMLRPLRHPGEASPDESARLATVQTIVEHHTFALADAAAADSELIVRGKTVYSDQPPTFAVVLSGVYWLLVRAGITLSGTPALSAYLLTLTGTTLPVAWSAALIYRMSRLFELPRATRAGLSIASVFGTGLISYATVLNPHAPAATMLLAAVGALVHVASRKRPGRGGAWFVIAGFCAALAVALDPPAIFIAAGLLIVIVAMRLGASVRAGGVLLFLIGATPPLLLHVTASTLSSGRVIPVSVLRDLAGRNTISNVRAPVTELDFSEDDDLASRSWWLVVGKYTGRFCTGLIGSHGLFSHFPVMIVGVFGLAAVMHRHWPAWTKALAVATAGGAMGVVGLYSFSQADWREAMFATRWFVLFVPLLFFWAGAWLRRDHSPLMLVSVAVLLVFSTAVSLIGATNPYPRHGFDRYTASGALLQLIDGNHPSQRSTTPLADGR